MREILLAGEEPHERPALLRDVVADRAAQHRIARLERVEHASAASPGRRLRAAPRPLTSRQRPQVRRQDDADHDSVCTSTESTAGRSRTIGAQLVAAVGRGVDLSAGRAEVDAARIERIDGHRVAQHVHVAVALRQTLVSASHSLPPVRLR